jgi:hypothetical protein
MELLFLLSFTLHNIEEALWLPKWSKYAKPFHPEVTSNEFHFAVLIVTVIGYALTFLQMTIGNESDVVKYVYLGFVLMMSVNSIFPHLLATFIMKRYCPGTITGILLILPIGLYLVFNTYGEKITNMKLIMSFVLVALVLLILLKPLFKLGNTLFREDAGS